MSDKSLSRRDFVSSTSKLALGATILPRHVLGGPGYRAPSDTLNLAIVGAGGQGIVITSYSIHYTKLYDEVCPVDCIYEGDDQFYIHPDECIDCGACEPECPVSAIYAEDDLPEDQEAFREINISYNFV